MPDLRSPRRSGAHPGGVALCRRAGIGAIAIVLAATACGDDGPLRGTEVDVRVPRGAGMSTIARELERAGLIDHPRLFALYVRVKGAERDLKAGHYRFAAGTSWGGLVDALRGGDVVTHPLTIPEGLPIREVADRIAGFTRGSPDSVRTLLADSALARELGVPGPTLEGYLFPETYRFAEDVGVRTIVATMVERYRGFWGARERALADSLGLDEGQVVTLASIVEEEARLSEERPMIAGVYLNRLERGMLLQADPTVQYALGEPKERLLYRDIDRVADDPYNTYTNPGLPPGPIASPGEASLRAVLEPARHEFLFFVAEPDGSHVFTRTEREHINAKNRIRRERGWSP
ncbi:MAG: endolytic transglycosylase MltG [Gemmatimonadota bacterium]